MDYLYGYIDIGAGTESLDDDPVAYYLGYYDWRRGTRIFCIDSYLVYSFDVVMMYSQLYFCIYGLWRMCHVCIVILLYIHM